MLTSISIVLGAAILVMLALTAEVAHRRWKEFMLVAIAVAGLNLLIGCPMSPPLPPLNPSAGTADDCKPACENLARLSCPGHEGSPGADSIFGTPDDVNCERACRDIVEADPFGTLYQLCVIDAPSCSEADRCLAEGS